MLGMLGEVAAPRIDTTQLPPEAAALIARLQQQVQAQQIQAQVESAVEAALQQRRPEPDDK